MGEFIGEEIEVHFVKKPGSPTSFTWRGREHKIVEIESKHRRLDFSKPWWRRRHRDYYIIKTDGGDTLRIYFHRGPGKKYWVLYERLEE